MRGPAFAAGRPAVEAAPTCDAAGTRLAVVSCIASPSSAGYAAAVRHGARARITAGSGTAHAGRTGGRADIRSVGCLSARGRGRLGVGRRTHARQPAWECPPVRRSATRPSVVGCAGTISMMRDRFGSPHRAGDTALPRSTRPVPRRSPCTVAESPVRRRSGREREEGSNGPSLREHRPRAQGRSGAGRRAGRHPTALSAPSRGDEHRG